MRFLVGVNKRSGVAPVRVAQTLFNASKLAEFEAFKMWGYDAIEIPVVPFNVISESGERVPVLQAWVKREEFMDLPYRGRDFRAGLPAVFVIGRERP